MLSLREPVMNMVRSTTAAFAAATGGADSITVLSPFLDGDAFSDRMARNTQTILREESSLYRAGDPGAGSGAIEALTNELAAAAWDQFTRIEAEGGLVAALETGSIQRAVAAMRDARLDAVARRKIAIVGVNVNIDRSSPTPTPQPAMAAESPDPTIEPVEPIRLSEPFEALCARSMAKDGARQRVLVVGPPARGRRGPGDAGRCLRRRRLRGGGSGSGARRTRSATPSNDRAHGSPAFLPMPTAPKRPWRRHWRSDPQAPGSSWPPADFPPERRSAPFDAVLTPDTDVVALLSDILDRIAEPEENGQS